jgi:hypothetical protein
MLELIEHPLVKSGQRKPLTHTLDPTNARAHHHGSIRRTSGFVQTRLASSMSGRSFPETGRSDTARILHGRVSYLHAA